MRLRNVSESHDEHGRARLDAMREARGGVEPGDVLKVFCYRPELFGEAFCTVVDDVLRGPGSLSDGERELIAAFVSARNQCPF
jgi:hypothetical protein